MKILTEEDLTNYTAFDLVLPLAGYDVKYPNNEMKNYYKELLEEHGLSLEMPKQSVKYIILHFSFFFANNCNFLFCFIFLQNLHFERSL